MILIVGYGNLMRCDDGVGIYVVKEIAKRNAANVKTITAHQLHVELLEEAIQHDKVILIDAAESGEPVVLRKIEPPLNSQIISSHHLGPELFLELAKTIYQKDLDLYLCSIKGEKFEIGDTLSKEAQLRAKEAIEIVYTLIDKDLAYA